MTPGYIQSFPKPTQYLTNLPKLLWLQWNLSYFVISLWCIVCTHFSIVNEVSGIFEWGLLQVTPKTIWQNWHDPWSGSVTEDQQESWMDKPAFLLGKSVDSFSDSDSFSFSEVRQFCDTFWDLVVVLYLLENKPPSKISTHGK